MAVKVALVATGMLLGVVAGAALGIHAQDEGDAIVDDTPEVAEVATPEPEFGVWDRLASCESSGNWHIVGRTYSGGLQFDRPTWLAYGGGAYASTAAGATRAQQIDIAVRLRAARGYAPWPVCSRVVGLR